MKIFETKELNWKKNKKEIFPDKIVIYPEILTSDDGKFFKILDIKIEVNFKKLKNVDFLPVYVDTEEYMKNNFGLLPIEDSATITDREVYVEFIKQIEKIKSDFLANKG